MSSIRECQFSSFVEVIDSIPWADVLFRYTFDAGLQAMKTALAAFAVHDRKNLFVFRESSGEVFYLRWVYKTTFFFFLLHFYIILNYIAFTSFMLIV